MMVKRDKTVIFKPDGFQISTKDFLDMLKSGRVVAANEINCVQLSRGSYLVSLKTIEAAERLSSSLTVAHAGRSFLVEQADHPKQYIKLYDLPFEIAGEEIAKSFDEFGRVLRVRCDKHQFSNFYNGDRTVIIEMDEDKLDEIPESIEIDGFRGRVSCKRNKKGCRYCKAEGHNKASCPELKCNTCGVIGHFSRECPNRRCNHCFQTGHWTRQCPVSAPVIQTNGPKKTPEQAKTKETQKKTTKNDQAAANNPDENPWHTQRRGTSRFAPTSPSGPNLETNNRYGPLDKDWGSIVEDQEIELCMDTDENIGDRDRGKHSAEEGDGPPTKKK